MKNDTIWKSNSVSIKCLKIGELCNVDLWIDELKTLMKNLVKATERNNDMMEELIHNSQRKTREELNEVLTCLKSVVSGLQALKDIRTSEAIHSEENGRRQDNVVILKGSQKEQDERDFSKSESQTWQPNRNWLVGEDNYSLDASGIGTQIFSNKMKDPGKSPYIRHVYFYG